ncbi:MAG: PAS domain S-box protein, partial [Candidatus Omnitrophota bacterium]
DYYLSNTGKILNSVRDREPLEKEKVHKLFKDVLNVYKLFLARGLVKKRKELISNLILANIIPPEEMEMDSKVPDEKKRKQSHVRSDEARDLIINEVFSSNDSTIFQPALEVIIELIARYPKHYSKQFLPLLEESGKLPRFATALVDILIKAEKGGIKMFGDIDANHFIDQGKDIIKELCDRLPLVRREVISYLLKISEKSYKETEMVHDLLPRLGFFIATSEEFPKIAAVQVAEVINKTRAQRKQSQDERKEINVVLTGGKTMPEFLDYLTKIIDRELWKDIHIYQLCEYRFLPPEDNRSIAYFINQHLPQSLPEANRHFINGMNPDPDYVAKLEKAGGADVVVLGIGSNGRIGFNEPSDQFDQDSGSLALRRVVSQPSIGPYIMRDGYTMRLSDILKWNVILLAEGKNKADIIKKSLFGPITPQIPASRLQNKKRLKVVLDIGAMNIMSPNFFVSYKKAIRSVSRLEERSRELFEESPTPQHEINRDGIIIHANKAEAKMLGYDSPEDLLGMHVWDLIYIADVDKARARILSKFTKSLNDLPEVEARYMTRDGRIIWVLIKDHQVGIEDEIETIQSTLTDITRYKVMEEELTAMKDRFKDTTLINGELSGGGDGFVLMAGTVVSLMKKIFTDPAKTKFVEELARFQANIELMKDGDNDITESELQRVNRELSMLEKQIGIDFKDDKGMAEFYRSLLADLHKILLELADEAQDTTVRVVSPKASGDLNEDVTQDSIDDERRKLDKAIRSLEEPEDYDAELNKTASRISVRVSALRDDVEDFFSDDTDMLERYSLMVDELEERLNDALQDNGIELTDADIAAAETVAESNAEAELVYISRPKSKNSMSVSARVKALEGA